MKYSYVYIIILALSISVSPVILGAMTPEQEAVSTLTTPPTAIDPDELSRAIYHGDKERIARLVAAGVSLDRVVHYKMYDYILALPPVAEVIFIYSGRHSFNGDQVGSELIKLLVEAGADPNVRMAHGWTPLHMACGQYCEGIVSFRMYTTLIECGANKRIENENGETPVHILIERLQDQLP